ncbi:hypothetical protein LTR05_005090 [Lithohypha guttulata]|uniref:F-box domain-containing protein n=1 Tax=Lithohypha guttulata TaxID=1690604 RepID=A0AAN7YAY1_9EURO|nr:hypothetical protein LTR05_005090 [Lithohypha guttulata]
MNQEPTSSVLEHFRQQWQQEVHARTQQKPAGGSGHTRTKSEIDQVVRSERPITKPATRHPLADQHTEDNVEPEAYGRSTATEKLERLAIRDADEDEFSKLGRDEPKTALEHYERAVEKEGQGSLGVSLSHYRRAFRLDENVDKAYKEKHFAHKWKQPKPNPSNAAPTVPSTAHHSLAEAGRDSLPRTTAELISSWADCDIPNAEPMIEGDIPPPCPIRRLPTEVLLELLRTIAIRDVSVFARLASVCKSLAFHVHSENSIWKRVALGAEFGLASQNYHFKTDIQGRPVIWKALEDDDEDERPVAPIPAQLLSEAQDYRELFHSYPRIRFTGVYISTVNYTRSGGTSVTPATWGSQVHIVTYYRYLRFFRNGTLISLLTTHEPLEVVHLLTLENLAIVRSGNTKDSANTHHFANAGYTVSTHPNAPPPSAQAILKHALRGRWRLCHDSLESIEIGSNTAVPGDLHIETEGGAGPRYMYTMHLSLKHGNTKNRLATKNNKLVWKGFWSYNTVTNDWAEFQLRNDKAFWFSRVKSYGLGY